MPPSLHLVLPWIAAAAASACALAFARARRRDRVALQEAAEARSQSEARVRTLVERAAYGIYTATADGRFVDANAAFATMLGFDSVDELLRANITTFYVDPAERERILARAVAGTLPDWVEVEWRRRDGTPIVVRVSARAELDRDGRLLHCEAIVEDVTLRRKHDEVQRRSERLAALGRMLAGAAHELNNPLAAVSGFSQLLLRGELAAEVRQALETIDREANRAAAVVRDLLAFSRPGDQGRAGEPEECDVNAVARYVVRARRYGLETRGVRIRLELADGALFVAAHRSHVEQVLINLVANAEQALEGAAEGVAGSAAPRGDGAPRVTVRTARREDAALLEVEDNGPGIPPDALPFVWDPFWTTKRDGEGTGLGLSIVHEVVSRAGGSVDVESEPGRGARFRVALPLSPAREADAAATDGQTARRPLDVLVADPDGATADFLARLLARRGHAAVAAHDVPQALTLARQGFDVAVIAAPLATAATDPGDRPLLERLRALPGGTGARIVVVTDPAAGDDGAVAVAAEQADAVIDKPFDIEQLRRSIEAG